MLSIVRFPLDPESAAWTNAVALGKHEFGHMYFRMKSSALQRRCVRCEAKTDGCD